MSAKKTLARTLVECVERQPQLGGMRLGFRVIATEKDGIPNEEALGGGTLEFIRPLDWAGHNFQLGQRFELTLTRAPKATGDAGEAEEAEPAP